MLLSRIWTGMLLLSVFGAIATNNGNNLSAAVAQGAQAGITLAISIAGSMCLWCGVGKLMEKAGITTLLSKALRPILKKLFPSTQSDRALAGDLCSNLCANFLGLGNAATPLGISAARRLSARPGPQPCDELCRLIVLNTASIQLIPTNVAAIRSGLGCSSPFDILPAVWISSLCAAGLGLAATWLLGKLWMDV